MIQAQDQISIPKTEEFELLLDKKYWVFSGLIFFKVLSLTAFPQLAFVNYLLVAFLLVNVAYYFTKPAEIIFVFVLVYYSDMRDWASRFELISGGGTRILLLDVFFILMIVIAILHFLKKPEVYTYYLKGLVIIVTLFWLFNFTRGILESRIGYVIGEARFYMASILILMIVRYLRNDPLHAIRKLLQIVSLCSLFVAFYIIMMVVLGKPYEEGRYTPGNSEVEVLFYGLLICFLEIHYNKRLHILPYNKYLMAFIYLGLIFLAGVRSMIIVTVLASGYFMFISTKVSVLKKFSIIVAFIVGGSILLQFEAAQKVMKFQTEFIEIVSGQGNKHNRTSSDFRQLMWGIFWENLTASNQRMLIGRPFDNELIDISSLHWAHKEGENFVDNSLAHNDFLAIAMTNGLVFTGLFMLLLLLYSFKSLRVSSKDIRYAPYFLFLGVGLLSQIWQSGTNAEIKHYQFSIMLWFLVGFIALMLNVFKQPHGKDDTSGLVNEHDPKSNSLKQEAI